MTGPDGSADDKLDGGRGTGRLLLVAVFALALVAAVVLVLSDNARWLRLGVVAALWSALVGAFLAAKYRRQAADRAGQTAELQAVYELELEREIAARREYELEVEAEARRRVDQQVRQDLAALRSELRNLQENLEALLGGEVLVERVALRAEATRMRALPDQSRVISMTDDRIITKTTTTEERPRLSAATSRTNQQTYPSFDSRAGLAEREHAARQRISGDPSPSRAVISGDSSYGATPPIPQTTGAAAQQGNPGVGVPQGSGAGVPQGTGAGVPPKPPASAPQGTGAPVQQTPAAAVQQSPGANTAQPGTESFPAPPRETPRAEPARRDSVRPEPTRPEPSRREAGRAEPARREPARAQHRPQAHHAPPVPRTQPKPEPRREQRAPAQPQRPRGAELDWPTGWEPDELEAQPAASAAATPAGARAAAEAVDQPTALVEARQAATAAAPPADRTEMISVRPSRETSVSEQTAPARRPAAEQDTPSRHSAEPSPGHRAADAAPAGSGGGRRRRAEGAPTWESQHGGWNPELDEVVPTSSAGSTRPDDEAPSAAPAAGAHTAGRSVTELLAAYGGGAAPRHRRRRAED